MKHHSKFKTLLLKLSCCVGMIALAEGAFASGNPLEQEGDAAPNTPVQPAVGKTEFNYMKKDLPRFSVPAFKEFVEQNPNLRKVNLSYLDFDSLPFQDLIPVLKTLSQLEELRLDTCYIGSKSKFLAELLPHFQNLKVLELSSNGFTDDFIFNLLSAFSKLQALERLDLSHNGIQQSSTLLMRILTNLPKLKHLILEQNRFDNPDAIAASLPQFKNLEVLNLARNDLYDAQGTGLQKIIDAALKSNTLKELNLEGNEPGRGTHFSQAPSAIELLRGFLKQQIDPNTLKGSPNVDLIKSNGDLLKLLL